MLRGSSLPVRNADELSMYDKEAMALASGGKLRAEEVVADWRGDKNLGQRGCNKLGKVERKVQCCFLVEEWMCGGKYKGDPQNKTVIFLAWECGSDIYQGPSPWLSMAAVVVWFTTTRELTWRTGRG